MIHSKDILIKLKNIGKQLLIHDHKMHQHDADIAAIFEALKSLLRAKEKLANKKRIGFKS